MFADNAEMIRDAACVVLVDHGGAEPRLLLGQRRAEQIFLPSKWVFPGGRIDDDDRAELNAGELSHLPLWLHGFARGAARELAEETGIVWSGQLQPLARAITPPGRIRRFDTWFFLAELMSSGEPPSLGGDGEFADLGWFSFDDARRLDLPNITRLVLDDAAAALDDGGRHGLRKAPYYHPGASGFELTLIDCGASAPPP